MNKTYVSTDYTGCGYITAGKMYEFDRDGDNESGYIVDDEGDSIYVSLKRCGYLNNHNWTVHEVGTLAELNVKEGDVVEAIGYSYDDLNGVYNIKERDGKLCAVSETEHQPVMESVMKVWRIISRASDATPKTWGEMTDAEKGALLLAHHENPGSVEVKLIHGWDTLKYFGWKDDYAYRIRPEPKRKTVEIGYSSDFGFGETVSGEDYRITFDTIDGKPDVNSVKMEEL